MHEFPELGAVGKLHVFLAEIQLQFHQRSDVQELFPHFGEFVAEASFELFEGNLVCSAGAGRHQVGNGFGLGEVHFAVQESTLRKLTRIIHTAAVLYQQLQHLI